MNLDERLAARVARADVAAGRASTPAVVQALLDALAEFERTRSTGGPAPAETRNWGNEQHVPPPESASRRDMDPPARYGASNQKRSKP